LRVEVVVQRAGAERPVEPETPAGPAETMRACKESDAILFGSAGLPEVRYADGTEIAPQLTLRFTLDLYAGIRPIKKYPGLRPVLAGDPPIDYVIFRENTEGLYASRGGGVRVGNELAVDNMVISRKGTERIVKYAFRFAQKRKGAPADGKRRVTCVDKANVLRSMAFFREVFNRVASSFPGIAAEHVYVDAMALYMVQKPQWFDVVVMADVLEHLRRPEQTLLRMREFLRPGGYGVVSVPNIANFRIRLGLLLGRFEYEDEGILDRTHLRFFTKRSAQVMIEGAGYEVLEFHPGATRMPSVCLRVWPTLCAVHLVFKIGPRKERS